MFRFLCVALMTCLFGCNGTGTITQFEIRDWYPAFLGEFSNGDFVAHGQRISAGRVRLTDDDVPGLGCEHLAPAFDDTDFLKCARLYAKTPPGKVWVEVAVPPEPADFVGQDRDGARYFFQPGSAAGFLWVMPRGAAEFLPKVQVDPSFGLPYLHSFGIVVFLADGRPFWSPQAIEWERLNTGSIRTYRNGAFSPSFKARHIDAEGHVYVMTAAGFDRVSPDGSKTDSNWFTFSKTNQVFDVLGIGGDGRLYALSTAKTNFTGADTRADNEIPLEAIMAMSHGETEWSQVSEPFSTPESRAIGFGLEKPYNANQGRDGSWWFSKCIANCDPNGANNSHQSMIWQWNKAGGLKSSTLDRTYSVWRGNTVTIQLPKHGDLQVWKLGSAPAEAGLSFVTASDDVSSLTLAVAKTARPGTYALTATNPGGPSQSIELEVKGADTIPLEAPRKITYTKFSVVSAGDRTIWLDVNGAVHFRDSNLVSTVVPGLPPAQSVEGEYVHAVDGRVFILSADPNPPYGIIATALNVPAIHSMHLGAGLAADGRVYLLRGNGAPIEGLDAIVSISCHQTSDVSQGGRLSWALNTLDAEGREASVSSMQTFITPLVTPSTASRALVRVGVGGTALGSDGRLVNGLETFGTSAVKSFDSIIRFSGQVGSETYLGSFPLVVTHAGEAWIVGAWLHPMTLPAGRKAEVMIAGGAGQLVWLDDGTVLDMPPPNPQSPGSTSVGTPLVLPGLATPQP